VATLEWGDSAQISSQSTTNPTRGRHYFCIASYPSQSREFLFRYSFLRTI